MRVSDDFNKGKFEEFQVFVNTDLGRVFSIQIPLHRYETFVDITGIEYVELSKKVYPKLDKALISANMNLVHEGENLSQTYSGRGVVVGVLDFGFDYTHPTFSDPETGTLRIKKIGNKMHRTGIPLLVIITVWSYHNKKQYLRRRHIFLLLEMVHMWQVSPLEMEEHWQSCIVGWHMKAI